ncbi:unnamed protein product [Thelazia callipaeda]|uniref:MH2 domain-containing protein n=1 Tax=Thelazia callipaeda TaxID=103827 RepID=A0A0N5CRV9_THECL|nr:unnamed protein product [Thelazia callipaeda]
MAFCRASLIERLLSNRDFGNGSSNSRSWNDIESFERDNILEVYRKLPNIEEQIWGKLIVMERNIRPVKAYLKSRIIIVDGSEAEFDGSRIGLRRFANAHRDEGTKRALESFSKVS